MRSTITPSVINIRATAGINYVKAGAGVTNTHATANIHLNYDSKNFATTDEFTLSDLPAFVITRTSADSLTLNDPALISFGMGTLAEALTASDTFDYAVDYYRTLTDSLVIDDLTYYEYESESTLLNADTLNADMLVGLGVRYLTNVDIDVTAQTSSVDTAILSDASVTDIGFNSVEVVMLSDLLSPVNQFNRTFNETLTPTEDVAINVGHNNLLLAEATLTDDASVSFTIGQALNGLPINTLTLN